MDSAAATITRINNILGWRPSTCRPSLLIQQRAVLSKPSSRVSIHFPILCTTKPGIDSDSATNKNHNPEAIEMVSNSTTQQPTSTTTRRNQPLPSTDISKGLVLDLGPENSWDGGEIGSPVVKRFIGDNEERWYMWYHGRSSETCNSAEHIGLAVSSNGINWVRGAGAVRSSGDVGMVMDSREKNWWAFDKESVRPSELVIMSSPMYSAVYWLYYTGFSSDVVKPLKNLQNADGENGKIFKSLPGLACSQDGRHWARIEGDHHSGALFDVGGGEKDWDSTLIAAPKVVVHENEDLRMYYHSFDRENGEFCIGVARSRDGIRWVKLGKILGGGRRRGCFDELGVINGHVVRNLKEGKYLMAYEGVDAAGVRSMGLAESSDGVENWVRVQEEAALRRSEGDGWDSEGVGSPCLVHMEGNVGNGWRLYYKGIGQGGRTGIGMAASEGSEVGIFRRWEGLQF